MRLVRHPDVDAFLRDAQPELERREAEHNLILGGALKLRAAPPVPGAERYFATVRGEGGLAVAALMTPPFPLVLAGGGPGTDAALDHLAADLLSFPAPPTAVFALDSLAEAFAERWTRAAGVPARVAMRERSYALTAVKPVPAAPGAFRRAGAADEERVARWIADFEAEALGERDEARAWSAARSRVAAGEVWLWEDGGEPRAMAASDRPTAHGIAVNAVYTPPEWRGRGYATACVARLGEHLLGEGRRFCVLFTDLANPTSNSIYRRIGYRALADYTLYRFGG